MRGAIAEPEQYTGAGPASISLHYDQSKDFFELWLGPTLIYSAAIWEGAGGDLDSAQLRKLDYFVAEARAKGAARVLDIGCGWGGTMRRLVDTHGVGQVVGITLSEAQAEFIGDRRDPRLQVALSDWRAYESEQGFDAIISLGAIEHFVRLGAAEELRAAVFRELFERCRSWLRPGGRLVIQSMTQGGVAPDRQAWRDMRLLLTKAYPNAGPPTMRELLDGSDGLFELVRLRNDRLDYAATQMAWHRNLLANRERAIELVGEEVEEMHERFMLGLARLFTRGQLDLMRLTFAAL